MALLWGLGVFWAVQLTIGAAVEHLLPDIRDQEFTTKLRRLRALVQSAPDRPLVVMLGSSRTLMAFDARQVDVAIDGRQPNVFNFGVRGGGPTLQLLCLRRLLAEGIKPDILLLEILLPLLNQPCRSPLEENWLNGGRLRTAELAWIRHYHSQPRRLLRHWVSSRFVPCSAYRHELRRWLLPDFAEPEASPQDPQPGPMDAYGWQPFFAEGVTPEQRGRFWDVARAQYRDAFGPFALSHHASQALETLLGLCRENGIAVALAVPPESMAFRALYPPETLERIQRYVWELSRREGLPLFDGSEWVEDDGFWDGHHALPEGAAAFTRRLQEEAVAPLLRAQLRLPRQRRGQGEDSCRTQVRTATRP
jgi:hypothetical protein